MENYQQGTTESTAESKTQYKTRGKYWRPDLKGSEWRLLERRMAEEIGGRENFLDEATKWVYADEKGVQVFALYGVGDGTDATPLYAVGGEKAAAYNAAMTEFMERSQKYDGDGRSVDPLSELPWRKEGSRSGNLSQTSRKAGDAERVSELHVGSQRSNAGGTAERGPEDQRGVKEKFSLRDSAGRELTEAQQAYFKDSKVRDPDIRYSLREIGGKVMPVLDVQNDTRDYKVAEAYLKTLVDTEHPFATILMDAQPVYIGKDLPGEYKGSEYTHGLNSSTRQVKMQAATNLDEMLLLAENGEWRDNVKEKHKQDAKNGWYRYSTRFALPVLDIKKAVDHYTVYSGTLLIRNDADGKSYLYDLLDIKKEKVISSPSFSARGRSEVFEPKPSQEQYMQNSRESQAENIEKNQQRDSTGRELTEIWDNTLMDAARNNRGTVEKAAPAESRRQARAESGESIEPGEKPLKGKHDNDKMGAVKDSLKEDLKNGKARKEDRGAFLRRSVEDGYQVFEGKSAAYGYRSVRRESTRENARQIQEELTELGIDAEIINGDVLWNLYGISSARSVLQATAVEKKILINDAASLAPKNTAGHEAYHLWYGLSARKTYEDVVIDNLRFSSKEFLGYQAAISEAYLGKEADLSDEAQYTNLVEEIVAYISGDIHEGVNDDLLRLMFHDYDAVKAAWVKLCKDRAGGKVQFQQREPRLSDRDVLSLAADMALRQQNKSWTPEDRNRLEIFTVRLRRLEEAQAELKALKEERKDLLDGRKASEVTKDERIELTQNRNRTDLAKKNVEKREAQLYEIESVEAVKTLLRKSREVVEKETAFKARQRYREKTENRQRYQVLKKRLERTTNEWKRMLLKPTKDRYAPEELVRSCLEVALMLDESGRRLAGFGRNTENEILLPRNTRLVPHQMERMGPTSIRIYAREEVNYETREADDTILSGVREVREGTRRSEDLRQVSGRNPEEVQREMGRHAGRDGDRGGMPGLREGEGSASLDATGVEENHRGYETRGGEGEGVKKPAAGQ